jgi:hypothetical protein
LVGRSFFNGRKARRSGPPSAHPHRSEKPRLGVVLRSSTNGDPFQF